MAIKFEREHNDQQRGGDVVITAGKRWLRVALYIGSPPGSHIGFWRTRIGPMRGLNLRIGRRYVGPCVTVFAHYRNGSMLDYLR